MSVSALWKSLEGEVYVTFPSRAFGAGSERRYFEYLRAIDGSGETVKAHEGVDRRRVPQGGGRGLKAGRGWRERPPLAVLPA